MRLARIKPWPGPADSAVSVERVAIADEILPLITCLHFKPVKEQAWFIRQTDPGLPAAGCRGFIHSVIRREPDSALLKPLQAICVAQADIVRPDRRVRDIKGKMD